jgi:dihydroorotase
MDPAAGVDAAGDLWVRDGRIVARPAAVPPDAVVVNAAGLLVLPGLIDLHVHLREPGDEAAETVRSGSCAAARGGFTTVVAMPNTQPAADTPEAVRRLIERGAQAGWVDVLPAAAITRGRMGRALTDFRALRDGGAVAFTDDGSTVADDALMHRALREAGALGLPVLDHALHQGLAGSGVMREGPMSRRAGFPGIPPEAETAVVERDIRLARQTGAAVHIQHVSAAGSVALIRAARREGLAVSGEATPHHLTFTDADAAGGDPDFKMNPPLGTAEDRAALLAAVADGTLEALATDHAPHAAAAKARGFADAPFGVVGLETAVAATFTALVIAGHLNVPGWAARWTVGPARVLGRRPPDLRPGSRADLILLDPSAAFTVDPAAFVSRSRNTPFKGRSLTGMVLATFRGGRPTWLARELLARGLPDGLVDTPRRS